MSDYLGDRALILGKVQTRQVQRLLSVLVGARLRKIDFIGRSYSETEQNFAETLQLLRDIGFVTEREGDLELAPPSSTISQWLKSEDTIREAILSALIAERSPYRPLLARYLAQFAVSGKEIKHRPSLSDRVQQRPMRDLMMDLRAVTYRGSDDTYVLEEFATPTYFWATNFVRPRSQLVYAARQRQREELGFAAELEVLEYERDRLGDKLAHLIEHVSADQPYSCFDIKSITLTDTGAVVDRYIEVKAVSARTLEFYWSRAEVDAAQILRGKYYLYLVPFALKHGFDTSTIRIIQDPHSTLAADDNWELESEVVVCRRKFD